MSQTEELTVMMAGSAACSAALNILNKEREKLNKRYSARYLENAEEKLKKGIIPEITLEHFIMVLSPKAFLLCGEKGVFPALYELGEVLGCGLRVGLYDIPIEQSAIELCDLKDINPYESDSTGSMVLAVKDAGLAAEHAEKFGIGLKVLGYTTAANARIVVADTERYLTPGDIL